MDKKMQIADARRPEQNEAARGRNCGRIAYFGLDFLVRFVSRQNEWVKDKIKLLFVHKAKKLLVYNSILILSAVLTLLACNTVGTKEELLKYVQNTENGLLKEKQIKNVVLKAMYKPSSLLVQQEIQNDSITKQELDSITDHYNNYLYFILSISENGRAILGTNRGSVNEFGHYVNQLAFGMDKKVFLVNAEQDTLRLMDYVYPRMYGMASATNMMFAFNKEKIENTEYIKLDVKDIGLQTGDVSFKFRRKDVENVPKLKLTK